MLLDTRDLPLGPAAFDRSVRAEPLTVRVEALDRALAGRLWTAIEATGGCPATVFQSRAFVEAALGLPAQGRSVVAIAERGGRPCALLALSVRREAGVRIARGLGAPYAQYDDVMGIPGDIDAVSGIVAAALGSGAFDVLLLRRVRADSALAPVLAARRAPYASDGAPVLDLASHRTFEAFLSSLPAKKRQNLRRGRRDLEAAGPVTFAVHTGRDARRPAQVALELKRRWIRDTGRLSPALASGAADVLLGELAEAGDDQMAVSVLAVADRPVAMEIGLRVGTSYAAFLGALDMDFSRASPGSVQMAETIRWCFESGLTHYDLLPPLDPYKARWTSTCVAVADTGIAASAAGRLWLEHWHLGLRPRLKALTEQAVSAVPRLLRRTAPNRAEPEA
ncbi:GNAT family N-acetyltransferase [Chthonobacter albigriseus]|uniref:GNAT family N-acetyltransferase n=1 Tax=Chthonobacter albigriseus TaxID=1683161 RepID=UPI0015EE76D7|nr:GNAT family N-acetyltransferase [Chthonobacter albigriseus]